jgi:hypothetical protein
MLAAAVAAALLTGAAPRTLARKPPLQARLPQSGQIPGWISTAAPRIFRGAQVFDYMDGAGEIPRSFGLVALASERYRKGAVTLEAAIFEMPSAQDAFGYFSARSFLERNPSGADRTIALDHPARVNSALGVLTFWKDRYAVILQPEAGVPDEKTLLQFARAVEKSIEAKGDPPAMLQLLPLSHAAQGTARFVRGKPAFDSVLIFSPTDVFGAGKGATAVAEEVETPAVKEMLAVIRYPSPAAASAALAAYRQYLTSRKALFAHRAPAGGFIAAARTEKGTGACRAGSLLCLVAYAKPPHSPTGAADAGTVAAALDMLRKSASRSGR